MCVHEPTTIVLKPVVGHTWMPCLHTQGFETGRSPIHILSWCILLNFTYFNEMLRVYLTKVVDLIVHVRMLPCLRTDYITVFFTVALQCKVLRKSNQTNYRYILFKLLTERTVLCYFTQTDISNCENCLKCNDTSILERTPGILRIFHLDVDLLWI